MPLMLRTSLVERLAAANGGNRELLPITLRPDFLPISYQTIRNQLSRGGSTIGAGGGCAGLEVVRFNARVYVRTEDLLRLIWNSSSGAIRKKGGRKSNRQRAEEKRLSASAIQGGHDRPPLNAPYATSFCTSRTLEMPLWQVARCRKAIRQWIRQSRTSKKKSLFSDRSLSSSKHRRKRLKQEKQKMIENR
jgi:hypothetical protein